MAINPTLLKRIAFLERICHDEAEPCEKESLYDILSFLEINDNMPTPSLVVTPSGHFRATWKDNEYDNDRFSIEFLGDDQLKFVVRMSDNIFSFNYSKTNNDKDQTKC